MNRIRRWEATRVPAPPVRITAPRLRRVADSHGPSVKAPPVRIIALSANGSDAACQRDCLSAGMNGELCTPISRRPGCEPAPLTAVAPEDRRAMQAGLAAEARGRAPARAGEEVWHFLDTP